MLHYVTILASYPGSLRWWRKRAWVQLNSETTVTLSVIHNIPLLKISSTCIINMASDLCSEKLLGYPDVVPNHFGCFIVYYKLTDPFAR